jgi:hypothetical protein
MHAYFKLLLTCTLLIKNFSALSQIPDVNPSYHVKQDNFAFVFRTLNYSESQLKKYDEQKIYFWYKAQHVYTTQGGSSGTLLNGKFEAFYTNNQLAYSGNFSKGLKHGAWSYWKQNGLLEHVESWKKGKQIGKQFYYNDQGMVYKTICFSRNAQKIYTSDTTQFYHKTSVRTIIHDSLGKTLQIIQTKNGLLDGKQMQLDSIGKPQYVKYDEGKLIEPKAKKTKTSNEKGEKVSFTNRVKSVWQKIFKKKEKNSSDSSSEPKKEKTKKIKKTKEPTSAN